MNFFEKVNFSNLFNYIGKITNDKKCFWLLEKVLGYNTPWQFY